MQLQQLIYQKLAEERMTRQEFARRTGLTKSAITRLLRRQDGTVSLATVRKIWPVLYGEDFQLPQLPTQKEKH